MMNENSLGLLANNGNIIFSACLILYGLLYTYLLQEYGDTDE